MGFKVRPELCIQEKLTQPLCASVPSEMHQRGKKHSASLKVMGQHLKH